jgi:glutamate-1-semialdehyde 2,1-aminomutase
MIDNSRVAFVKAKQYIPGGVNSPVRSFQGIGGDPIFVLKAFGSTLTDIDLNKYLDFCMSWGVHILGHAPARVLLEVERALWSGTSYGLPTTGETTLAELVSRSIPSVEMVRLVNSGTEAVMSAVRLARAFTGKTKIIKFDGCYHGHVDHLLVIAGSGLATLGISSSPGVPDEFVRQTIRVPFNDESQVAEAFSEFKDDIAAVIVEPVPANMGVILPKEGFLQFLRDITSKYQSLLIFDEVITGFRPQIDGAQGYFGITPDLTTLGKIIGGGFSIGAYGGRKEIMEMVAPQGKVYQAGTLSGNPIAVTAGIAVLSQLKHPTFYETLNQTSGRFISQLNGITKDKGVVIHSFQSMFTLFFHEGDLLNFEDVRNCDLQRFERFYKKALDKGLLLSPSQFETNFISEAHSTDDLNKTLEIISDVLKTE